MKAYIEKIVTDEDLLEKIKEAHAVQVKTKKESRDSFYTNDRNLKIFSDVLNGVSTVEVAVKYNIHESTCINITKRFYKHYKHVLLNPDDDLYNLGLPKRNYMAVRRLGIKTAEELKTFYLQGSTHGRRTGVGKVGLEIIGNCLRDAGYID